MKTPSEYSFNLLSVTGAAVAGFGLGALQQQEAYFNYTDDLLHYVNFEGRQRSGKIVNTRPRPKKPTLPPLQISCA